MIVHKFGGTSLGDAECIARAADIILKDHQDSSGSVVVVSAISGVTNQLITGARAAAEGNVKRYLEIIENLHIRHRDIVINLLGVGTARLETNKFIGDRLLELTQFYRSISTLGELTARGIDAVVSFGEPLSAHILCSVIYDRGVHAQTVCATSLIVTDDNFGEANPRMELTQNQLNAQIRPLLDQNIIPVITGYLGATEAGVTTTLGRGGSDYSAAIIGAALGANSVWIWTDVNGILTADPNIVPHAQTLVELSYTEAANLAYFGAEVLHRKTIRPLIEKKIPLRILNSFNPNHAGTLIVEKTNSDRELRPAIISTAGLTLITVSRLDDTWSLDGAVRALQKLSKAGVAVMMFSQSFAEHSLNLVVSTADCRHATHILESAFINNKSDTAYKLDTIAQVATISIAGLADWNQKSISSYAFSALGKLDARVIAITQTASEQRISFCVPEAQADDVVRFLHAELASEKQC